MSADNNINKLNFEEKFLNEHVTEVMSFNLAVLAQANLDFIRDAVKQGLKDPVIADDYWRQHENGVPEHFKYMDVGIAILKNDYIVVAVEGPADTSIYNGDIGRAMAITHVVNQAAALKAFEFKSKKMNYTIPPNVIAKESKLCFSVDVFSWVINLGSAIGQLQGIQNTDMALFNVDMCLLWPENDFIVMGYSQLTTPHHYHVYDSRQRAFANATAKLQPYLEYQGMWG